MLLLFGYGKLTGYAGTVSYMGSLGLPAPALFTVLAIIIEIGAGLLVLVGYKTRLVCLAGCGKIHFDRERSRIPR